jgi:UPF0755 protein
MVRAPRKSKPRLRKPKKGARASSAPPPRPVERAAPPSKRPIVVISPGARRVGYAFVAALLAAAIWLLVYPSLHGPGAGNAVEVTIEGGETSSVLTDELAAAGLLSSPRLFGLYVAITGGASSLVKGVHLLTDDASPGELMARLERRAGATKVRVTFPEGWTRFDMAKRLQEKKVCSLRAFLDATVDPQLMAELRVTGDSMEGFLFPSTYELSEDSDGAEVVRRMKGEFDRRWIGLEQKNESGVLDLSKDPLEFGPREIVTLASMVEKEAAVDEERPIIASVFLNRLRDADFHPKLLQCDPTAGYGCLVQPELAACAAYAGKITPAINADADNRYSTYKHEGLPPGPISNPGAKSINAVMSPAMTRYFYFVAQGNGHHTFSETYVAHAAAVRGAPKP